MQLFETTKNYDYCYLILYYILFPVQCFYLLLFNNNIKFLLRINMNLKRLMRSRTIFVCLILIFIIYVGLNQYFLNLVGLHQEQNEKIGDEKMNSNQKREKLNEIPKQIVNINYLY